MGPGDIFPALSSFVSSPMYTLWPSSLLAYGNPNRGFDFSTDKGNLPKEVLAYLESNACANAVNPAKVRGFVFFS